MVQKARTQPSNDIQYMQLKVAMHSELAAAFKSACAVNGVSMASVITGFLEVYCHANTLDKGYTPNLSTKRQRRAAVRAILDRLTCIKDNEENFMENIPVNLQASEAFFTAENCISLLEDAIEALAEAY